MNKKLTTVAVLLLVMCAVISACTSGVRLIRGSGNVITETRQVGNFDSIELSGFGEVIVTQGGSESLSIETDDNVIEHVEAVVEGGALKLGLVTGIQTGFNIQSATRLVFYVGVDDLSRLSTSGSGNIVVEKLGTGQLRIAVSGSGSVRIADLSASKVNSEISGSGEIELLGDATAQNVDIGGSGKYLGGDLCSASVDVSVSGSGGATVCATETLDANVSGSGSINYYGEPTVNSTKSGSGSINSLGGK